MMRRTLTCLVGFLLVGFLLIGLTACSISVPSPAPSATSSPGAGRTADPSSDAQMSDEPQAPASSSAEGRPSDASLGPVVASRSSSYQGTRIDLDLYQVVRDGHLAHVTFTVRSDDAVTLGDLFSDRESHDYEADGITLIDTAAKKLYLVASHGQGACLCTATGTLTIDHEPSVISASFAAPPNTVTAMDVQIPHFGVFSRVPIV